MQNAQSIISSWGLPKEISERLGKHAGRQRTMLHEGHLLIILHKLPEIEMTTRDAAMFYRNPKGEWQTNVGNSEKAIGTHLQTYSEEIEKLSKAFDEAQTAKDYFYVFNHILPIARAAGNQFETLQEAREAVREDTNIICYRDEAYDIKRSAELLCEEAQHALDYKAAQRAEEQALQAEKQAIAAHRLNMIAAFFFPITAVASIFGVNLTTGLEGIQSPIFFWILAAFSLGLGYVVCQMISEKHIRNKKQD